ncbi:MAG: class I SAM-dependent methyltransferase [Pseudomonadota bacterium]
MTVLEDTVSTHYTTGDLVAAIRNGLVQAGADADHPRPDDLKGVDEFHTGGLEATEELLAPLGITAQTRVLDIGCGIGGTARFIHQAYGAHVTGVDLTPAFVDTAHALTEMVGLQGSAVFLQGSALDLPVGDGAFDLATMIHVGMNIGDKPALFAEVARVLAPGGQFALFDIMLRRDGELSFPVPWASSADHSFVTDPQAYRDAATGAGLTLEAERDRGDYAVAFFKKVMAATEKRGGPPPVGLQLLMGPTAPQKYGNIAEAIIEGTVGPWEMVFRKP